VAATLLNLLEKLKVDPWRERIGFSSEMAEAQNRMFDPAVDAESVLAGWLQAHQPCLFGRVAAKLGLIRYCILRESDLTSDRAVRDLIQTARRRWTREAFDGRASGFIVLLISPRLASAAPDEYVAAMAHNLCTLYLRDVEVEKDAIHHEHIWYEKPGPERMTWQWLAGVNYFSAHGDQRWWQDHRMPGGMAFSVNSVGHMAKSAHIAEVMNKLNEAVGAEPGEFSSGTIRSLEEALKFAMLTIDRAANAVSGKATNLIEKRSGEAAGPSCPFTLPPKLASKDPCSYEGWYHTDFTLPSEYFRPEVERPAEVPKHQLDFTYLFDSSVENSANEVMGHGGRIRGVSGGTVLERGEKARRMQPSAVPLSSCQRLAEALESS
jgi:hypothetical protein